MISPGQLYQPEKYKVILGNGISSGFCTLWNEPEKAIKEYPELLNRSAIIGTLYSRHGVNVVLRNLALNPQIKNLYLWTSGSLSCSPFGISGKEILIKLWEKGLGSNKEVIDTDFKIEKEIDAETVNRITKNVRLEQIPDQDLSKVINGIKDENSKPYMDPVSFAEAVPEAIDLFPSEKVGFLVRGKTVIEAWTRVVDRIIRYGTIKNTQYGTKQKELVGVTWVINNEDPDNPKLEVDWPSSLKKTIGLNNESIAHYRSIFLSADKPEGIEYTYGNRLMRYPNNENAIDQIEEIIIRGLKESVDTRRAVATTLVPSQDKASKEPPCITQVQALQSEGKLHFLVTARSHDIFKAAIPNAFGLLALQKKIAKEVDLDPGSLQITSQSAHIYEPEWDDAKKLVECSFWKREPALTFDPAISADPRGLFLVGVENEKISVYFKSPSGDDLLTITGKTANELAKKISQLELINLPEHLMDIGSELQKAEIALSHNLPYTQDRPLVLSINKDQQKSAPNVCLDC